MSALRAGAAGATRACPHCREIILESAGVCPACRHYLRFDGSPDAPAETPLPPLTIEGSIRHPPGGEAWEYTVVVTLRNDRGEEIARKLIGVGAMQPNEQCSFTLSVETEVVKGKRPARAVSLTR